MKSTPVPILLLVLLSAAAGLALEWVWPALSAAGICYLAAVAAAGLHANRDAPYLAAAGVSLATVFTGFVAAISEQATAATAVGRLLLLLAIWGAAVAITRLRRHWQQQRRANEETLQRFEQVATDNEQIMAVMAELQQALRDAEASYSSLVEHLPVHVVRKDRAGRITFANRTLCELLNRPIDEVLGRTDFDFFPSKLAEKYRQDDYNVISRREVFKDVEHYQGPDGTQRYMQVMKSPVIGGDGEVIGVQGIFWDVSENKRQEAELRESEVRKRALFEASMDAIILSDHEAKIVEFNRAAEKMFGYSRKQ